MIGVNKDFKNKFSSHAWIELNDLIFYENIEKFKVIKEINWWVGYQEFFQKIRQTLNELI